MKEETSDSKKDDQFIELKNGSIYQLMGDDVKPSSVGVYTMIFPINNEKENENAI